MKKVGIVTFNSAHNYGAVLQAYALQEKLKELGVEPYIINYRNKEIDDNYKILKIRTTNRSIKQIIRDVIVKLVFLPINYKKYSNFEKFMKKYFNLSKRYNTEKEIKDTFPNYDIYIAGSDQIWNPVRTGNKLSDIYTLNFGANKTKRVSYAASIGVDSLTECQKEDLKEKLSILDEISVREETAQKILNEVLNKEVKVVLDPVFLHSADRWNEFSKENKIKEKYILVYSIEDNPELIKITNYLSEKTGYKVIHFKKKSKCKNPLKSVYTSGPKEYISLIKNAEYVINNSFHATVFSIIFNKEFYTIPHSIASSRMADLLSKLNIKNRLIYNIDEFKSKQDSPINYCEVNDILERERKKSIDYLKEILE